MDSSRAEVCSGEVPCLEGRCAERDSFSTYWEGGRGGGVSDLRKSRDWMKIRETTKLDWEVGDYMVFGASTCWKLEEADLRQSQNPPASPRKCSFRC